MIVQVALLQLFSSKWQVYGVLICVYVWPLHTSFTTTAPRFTHGIVIGYIILPIHSLRPMASEVLMAVECPICRGGGRFYRERIVLTLNYCFASSKALRAFVCLKSR